MKGESVTAIVVVLALMGCFGTGLATPPIVPPVQYEQFCQDEKVAGSGIIDLSTSIVDKKIALVYSNAMSGLGDLELDQEHSYSQNADKLKRNLSSVNDSNESSLNLYESSKLTYSGETPLVGQKYIQSKGFYGGIGAQMQEVFSVNEMEKNQETFFTSTTPYQPDNCSPDDLIKQLKEAGRNTTEVDELMRSKEGVSNPAHLIGLNIQTSFNGTWGTDASWHKIFYKDIKAHEMFSGKFETEKLLKFHESPVPENIHAPCDGIDC
jgi:hypothetical protein